MLKRCEICGKEFDAFNNRKTCSEECKIELKVKTLRRIMDRKNEKRRTGNPVGRPRKTKYKERVYFPNENDTLCWSCQNAVCGCSWSRALKPVRGWKVEAKTLQHNHGGMITYSKSYKVISCPKYKQDEPRKAAYLNEQRFYGR